MYFLFIHSILTNFTIFITRVWIYTKSNHLITLSGLIFFLLSPRITHTRAHTHLLLWPPADLPAQPPGVMPLLTAGGLQGSTAGWCWCCPSSPADRSGVSRGKWIIADLTNVNMSGRITSWVSCSQWEIIFTLRCARTQLSGKNEQSGEEDCDILRLSKLKLYYITMGHDGPKGAQQELMRTSWCVHLSLH